MQTVENVPSVQTAVIDGNRLSKIANKSHTAAEVVLALAKRNRYRTKTNVNQFRRVLLKQNVKIVEPEYVQFWKDLEEAGMGAYIHGRKGNDDYFAWYYNLKNVANAALEGKSQEAEKLEPKRKPGRPPKAEVEKKKAPKPETKRIIFPLRNNFDLTLEVPTDITKEEAENIGEILKVIIK